MIVVEPTIGSKARETASRWRTTLPWTQASVRSIPMSQRVQDCIEAVGQSRGSRLQDQRRFDFDDAVIPYRRNCVPSGPLPDPVGNDLLAAPRGENDVGCGNNHILWRNNTVFGGLVSSQLRKYILPTGDLD